MAVCPSMTSKTVALVTGANRGIGLEIARQLGQQGLVVVLGARDESKGAAAAAELSGAGIDAHAVKLDGTRDADVAALPGYFRARHGRLDVLVNNAGIVEWNADDVDSFRRTLEVNVMGSVAVTYALLPLLRESPAGRIVNQSSVLGSLTSLSHKPKRFRRFMLPAYIASKAALNGLTVALAQQAQDTPLKINAAHPGWVRTELGGRDAPMSSSEGAQTAVLLATLPADGPSGQFFHLGQPLPW
jgi:NAD(P)-dependent dehydrogenase (short-subunit alcohol dehydrogenase family)